MPKFSAARALCASLVLVATATGAATNPAKQPAPARVPGSNQVQSTTLANGMKVIVWTDRDIPNIALFTIKNFGGWGKAQAVHFNDGGLFDQILEEAKR